MLSLEEIERMTDNYIDEQIKELNEREKKQNIEINELKKEINFIFKNLNSNIYEYNFKFFEEENDQMGNYNCLILVSCESYSLYITNIYYTDEYDYINLMTLEQIKTLKDYQEQKNKDNQIEENLESEF